MNKSIKTALNRLCGDPKCARERLLQTAGMLYAERGLDAVSTRELTGLDGDVQVVFDRVLAHEIRQVAGP